MRRNDRASSVDSVCTTASDARYEEDLKPIQENDVSWSLVHDKFDMRLTEAADVFVTIHYKFVPQMVTIYGSQTRIIGDRVS